MLTELTLRKIMLPLTSKFCVTRKEVIMYNSAITRLFLALFAVAFISACEPVAPVEDPPPLPTCTWDGELDCENPPQEDCVFPQIEDGFFGCENPPQEPCEFPQVEDGFFGCEDPGVTTGTTSGDSSNGLRYADGVPMSAWLDFSDEGVGEPVTMNLRAAKLASSGLNDNVLTSEVELVDLEITIFKNEGGTWITAIDMGGETVLINTDETGNCGMSSAGNWLCFDWFQVSESVYAIIFEGGQADTGVWSGLYGGTFAGLETDPDLLAYKGLTYYEGAFGISVTSIDEDFWVAYSELNGGITFTADFGSGAITDGNMLGDGWDVDFAGTIEGNGWTAADTGSEIFGGDLEIEEGGVQLDGVFYGETGGESAGTILVDTIVGDGEDFSMDVIGVGGFIAGEILP